MVPLSDHRFPDGKPSCRLLIERITAISAIIAWGGLSVHAQVAALRDRCHCIRRDRRDPQHPGGDYHSLLIGPGLPLVSRLLVVPTVTQDTTFALHPLSRLLTATGQACWFLLIPLGLILLALGLKGFSFVWFRVRMPRD